MNENFFVTIFDWSLYQTISILVKSKSELTRLISSLGEAEVISQIVPIPNLYDADEYIKELRERNTEDGLNFGKTE